MFRHDRRNRFRGGGLLVYDKSDFCPHLCPDLTNPTLNVLPWNSHFPLTVRHFCSTAIVHPITHQSTSFPSYQS